jgi:hypothetical protein
MMQEKRITKVTVLKFYGLAVVSLDIESFTASLVKLTVEP